MTTVLSSPVSSPRRSTFVLLLGFLLGIGASWVFGFFAAVYHPTEESKVCHNALVNYSDKLHPQTREYLKARLYSNAAIWMSPASMAGWNLDFGPVDDTALAGIRPVKDAASTKEIYQAALEKHGLKPK